MVGSGLDFGDRPRDVDRYAQIAKLAPHEFHTHAKTYGFRPDGEEIVLDGSRIVKDVGYKGAVPIEWEGGIDPVEGVV